MSTFLTNWLRVAQDSSVAARLLCGWYRAIDGFRYRDSQMRDQRFDKHAGRIQRQNDAILSTWRKLLPFRTRFTDSPILSCGANVLRRRRMDKGR